MNPVWQRPYHCAIARAHQHLVTWRRLRWAEPAAADAAYCRHERELATAYRLSGCRELADLRDWLGRDPVPA